MNIKRVGSIAAISLALLTANSDPAKSQPSMPEQGFAVCNRTDADVRYAVAILIPDPDPAKAGSRAFQSIGWKSLPPEGCKVLLPADMTGQSVFYALHPLMGSADFLPAPNPDDSLLLCRDPLADFNVTANLHYYQQILWSVWWDRDTGCQFEEGGRQFGIGTFNRFQGDRPLSILQFVPKN